jgi:hypothetical protein
MFRSSLRRLALPVFAILLPQLLHAQEVMFDQVREVGGLTVYPIYGDPLTWYYLPSTVRIARDNDGRPQFSFIKFARNAKTEGEGGITRGEGGGVITFLVTLDAPDSQVRQAETQLAAQVPGAHIVGPIAYHSGNFMVYTTAALDDDGSLSAARQGRILGVGKAPLMAGTKAAVGLRLSAEDATIMWESFNTGAADLSVMFEMFIRGYYNPAEGYLKADWRRIAKNETVAAGIKTDILGADLQRVMKQLETEEAIVVRLKESDAEDANEKLDRLTTKAYDIVIDRVFTLADQEVMSTLADDTELYSNLERASEFNEAQYQRTREENQAEQERYDKDVQRAQELSKAIREGRVSEVDAQYLPILDMLPFDRAGGGSGSGSTAGTGTASSGSGDLGQMLRQVRPAEQKSAPAISIVASYHTKSFDINGQTEFNISLASVSVKPIGVFSENIAGLVRNLRNDPRYFREINLDDPAYQQREVLVSLDGQDASDFDKFVNYVLVSIKKRHQNGEETVDELKIDKTNYQQSMNAFRLMYGYNQDTDRDRWLQYDYRVIWNLYGGVQWDSGWQTSTDYIIPAVPPHRYRELRVEADPAVLQEKGVRHATVDFSAKLLGGTYTEQVELRPSGPSAAIIKYAHLPGDLEYSYDVRWRMSGGTYEDSGPLSSEDGTIYADEMPASQP